MLGVCRSRLPCHALPSTPEVAALGAGQEIEEAGPVRMARRHFHSDIHQSAKRIKLLAQVEAMCQQPRMQRARTNSKQAASKAVIRLTLW